MKHPFLKISLVLATLLGTPVMADDKIAIAAEVPFAAEASVTDAVRRECGLPEQVSSFVSNYAGDAVEVRKSPGGGKVLDMQITQVLGVGGPFTPKSLVVEGKLKEGGKVVASFRARRNTGGGPTCAALAKCAKSLGKDIAGWLDAPSMDAKLGDAR
jgi:hypothetical protein